jgi:hypothetical protein
MKMPQTWIASIIGLMRLSSPGRTVIIAIVLVGVTELPTKAFPGPQKQVPTPSGQTKQSCSRKPTSTPAKQLGTLIEYRNAQYGFCFSLPESWQGYSIVVGRWEGHTNGSHGDAAVQHGPIISIRHPQWTQADPRQDIPIMVFTRAQWRSLQHEEFHVSAAPIGPSELGRNRRYVFGLPPRFDYAFPTGYEEVEQILSSNPLRGECQARGRQR